MGRPVAVYLSSQSLDTRSFDDRVACVCAYDELVVYREITLAVNKKRERKKNFPSLLPSLSPYLYRKSST